MSAAAGGGTTSPGGGTASPGGGTASSGDGTAGSARTSRGDAGTFRARVEALVRAIPRGRVITYGQIALLAGRPRAARQVGWIAHAGGPAPWQRVVHSSGELAAGFTGGREGHRRALARDGVRVGTDGRVDLRRYLWWPDGRTQRRLRLSED